MLSSAESAQAPALRVGLASFGMVSRVFHGPLISATPGLQLTAIASSSAQKVQQAYPRVHHHRHAQALIEDPQIDVVVVTTPNDTHVPLALAAIEHGKHVVVEKPISLDAQEAADLVAAAQGADVVVAAFHNRRWDGDLLTLAEVLRSGQIGRAVTLHSHFDRYQPQVRNRWREVPGPGAGLLADLGPHLVDQALLLFGPPEWVWGDVAQVREGAAVDDYAHVVLGYPGGLRVILHMSALTAAAPPRFTLHGTQGSVLISGLDPQEDQLGQGLLPGRPGYGLGAAEGQLVSATGTSQSIPRRAGEYQRFYERLRDAIHGTGPNPVPIEEAANVMQVLDIARAAPTPQALRLPYPQACPPRAC
ncbi:oxidoreductase [Gephyromycinifex aptenodytis]|uniref:oxidoreductase n=1 Tax=Gephyromycinifex aptenodytis TaxID=2716227 RepID=UPI0014485875|nr:oxidoreductase [Gephyromycinifex aptenodytis]